VQVQIVAAALEIHPFMLSKWRKDAKAGRLRGRPKKAPPPGPAREIAHLQVLERKYAQLQEESSARDPAAVDDAERVFLALAAGTVTRVALSTWVREHLAARSP
jgi:transposase-like protein